MKDSTSRTILIALLMGVASNQKEFIDILQQNVDFLREIGAVDEDVSADANTFLAQVQRSVARMNEGADEI